LQLGFDSVHFARIDYQDRAKRKSEKSLEVIWRASKTFGSSAQIFANTFPVHYSAPHGFNFEVSSDFVPLQVPTKKPIKILMLMFIYFACFV
jgi:alpha-mannosidase